MAEVAAAAPAVTLYGFPQSTFVRTARMILSEKGVDHALEPIRPGTPEARALHPFGRVPILRHGEVLIYETAAIARYVDETFAGPALQPEQPVARAQMEKWISIVGAYMDPVITRRVILERLLAPRLGRRPNEAVIRAALPQADRLLSLLEADLAERSFLAGETTGLADFFVYPILFYIGHIPEAQALLGGREAIGRWRVRIEDRPSCKTTVPQRG
jgi:glutathione S-transferase